MKPTTEPRALNAADPRNRRDTDDRAEDMNRLTIISFGFLHGEPPTADITQDMRPFRDPHVDPAMRQLTGHDQPVIDKVLGTPGVWAVLNNLQRQVLRGPRPLTIAIGCASGRHRSVVVADQLALHIRRYGPVATLVHRDIHRPVETR